MTVSGEDIKSTIKSIELDDSQAEKLAKLVASIPDILSKVDNPEYDEIFGYRINTADKPHVNEPIRNEILLKFLITSEYDVEVAIEKIIKTLNWRNEFQPLSAAFYETFDEQLNEMGVITYFPNSKLHLTAWSIYGNLKNPKKIFETEDKVDLPGTQFIRWRIGLMEKSLQLLDFTSKDNNKVAQIHDYNKVSFLRIDSGIKKSTNEIVAIFGDNYPELSGTKFFINVPLLLGGSFRFFKSIGMIGKQTLNKFQVLNNGNMSGVFNKSELPKTYGGELDAALSDLNVVPSIKLTDYGAIMLNRKP
ncbi:conserved hypothetical protein [Candida tropicalis MYA-3404]|uniref:Phosphatidylinositol transfer protein SFH5 n=1 Tax=Candida tropicalis (strain ATCC MYA-3404 / T1) TaxID=294747 RepID=C5MB68_CANTT|nr:conserved hypothetical protein [Candida tropicalis MYA-3404]EER32885.1 conserved hypothetical protein [Candida tropicalis MYA-3404]KAG4406712.1 hypothetical protein JTP64_004096 [Candida tropicalis]